jgi:C4-dicarboxylate-specific signal transduction histidine kinase
MGLRTFSRESDGEKEDCSLTSIIDRSIELIEVNRKKSDAKIEWNKSEDSTIFCRKIEIEQVLINILLNALYVTQKKRNKSERIIKINVKRESYRAKIRITDPGNGIEDYNLDKIFNPFFTTKEVGLGTGLGLSISKGIIEAHGGNLYYELFEGKTSFVILVPIVEKVKTT